MLTPSNLFYLFKETVSPDAEFHFRACKIESGLYVGPIMLKEYFIVPGIFKIMF
jgi:hypothetical protein